MQLLAKYRHFNQQSDPWVKIACFRQLSLRMTDLPLTLAPALWNLPTDRPFWRSALFKIGVLLLALSASSWLALIITTAQEQARTPGNRMLGRSSWNDVGTADAGFWCWRSLCLVGAFCAVSLPKVPLELNC